MVKRIDGRSSNELRPLKISYNSFGYADSAVLFEVGNTKVLVSVSLQMGVPHFLKGKKAGWLTAEYAMLPTATTQRTTRESTGAQRNGRSVEISRLIGRCLRPLVDLTALGEKTIYIDCDVLQADGGTRVACITAASVALERAAAVWLHKNQTSKNVFKESIAGISVGIVDGQMLLDPCQSEDSQADADFNFVLTKNGHILEVQGTAEKTPIAWNHFDELKGLASKGINEIFAFFVTSSKSEAAQVGVKTPLFSLLNRDDS